MCLANHMIAFIDRIPENACNAGISPVIVSLIRQCRRSDPCDRDTLLHQGLADLHAAVSLQRQIINMADHRRGFRVNDEMPRTVGILLQAHRRLPTDKLSLTGEHHLPGGHLPGDITAVHVVQDVFERRDIHHLVALPVRAVVAVIDRDITDVVLGKIDFDIAAGLDVVASQAAKILGQDCPHGSRFDVGEHTLKARAVKIPPGISVVNIVFVGCKAVFLSVIR